MKSLEKISIVLLIVFAMAGCGFLAKKSGDSGSKLDSIISRNDRISLSIAGANIAFVKALEKTDIALGHSKRASDYKSMLNKLEKSKSNPSALFSLAEQVSELASAKVSLTASKVALSDSSKAYVKEALLYTMAGGLAESIAVKESAELIKEAKDEVVKAKSNMTLGAVSKLGKVIDDLQKVAVKIPGQVKIITALTGNLSEIARYNNISIPSQNSLKDIKMKINRGEI